MIILNYDQLFLVRHGEYCEGSKSSLTEEGKNQIRELAKVIGPLIKNMATCLSSGERRAIRSMFELQDSLRYDDQGRRMPACLDYIFSNVCLSDGNKASYEAFVEFANKEKRTSTCLATTHLEFAEGFPFWLLGDKIKEERKDFKIWYAEGVYINLKTGEYQLLKRN